jgi:hypothetical protein
MTTTQMVILALALATFVGIGVWALWRAVRIPWPSGKRITRKTSMGNEIVVIDASDEALIVACANATAAVFTAWSAYLPNAISGAKVFPVIGVHFIDDAMMDDVQATLLGGQRVAAYLSDASSSFKKIPLAVIRKSYAREVIDTGQPLMHEILHALMNDMYSPHVPGMRDHTHPTWEPVQSIAFRTYKDLWGPKP